MATEPRRQSHIDSGLEDFDFPGSHRILKVRADLVHLHNLHGSYFDLRILPDLSTRVPTLVTLHDQWMFTGHCAYTLDCGRWETGCGECPHLESYPAIPVDRTSENLAFKKNIYERSQLHISAPSHWLLDQAKRSILAPAIESAQLIRYGINLNTYFPGSKGEARSSLRLDSDRPLLLFSATRARSNPFKGWSTALAAFKQLGADHDLDVMCLGDEGPNEVYGGVRVKYGGYITEPHVVATWLRAADVYVHAAWSDNSPLAIIEAQACGTPVVASDVGGVPEIVSHSRSALTSGGEAVGAGIEGPTGVIVPPGSPPALASAVRSLLSDRAVREEMGTRAARFTAETFGLDRFIDETVGWYHKHVE